MKILSKLLPLALAVSAQATTISFDNLKLEREEVAIPDHWPDSNRVRSDSFSMTVDGVIDSFTILPFWSDLNNPNASFLPFEFAYESAVVNFALLSSPEPLSFEVTYPHGRDHITFSVTSDMGEFWYFMDYTHDHPSADLVFGYELKSIDYTPMNVPEGGSSVLLLGLGLLGIFYARCNIFPA